MQGMFGEGKPPAECWLDIYRRILAAGKQIQICGTPESNLEVIAKLHGTPYAAHWIAK